MHARKDFETDLKISYQGLHIGIFHVFHVNRSVNMEHMKNAINCQKTAKAIRPN